MSKGKIGTCPELNIKIFPPKLIRGQNDTRRTQNAGR